MHWGRVLLCSWPGLARLWIRGHLSSLVVAIGFGILLNLALVSTFLWPNSLGESFPLFAWPVLLLVWLAAVRLSWQNFPALMAVENPYKVPEDLTATLFNQAQDEYLKGHWKEAESLLRRRLNRSPRDVEARLLLCTLLRHSRKLDLAEQELDQLETFDQSQRWRNEINRERRLIELISEPVEPQVTVVA